MHAEAIRDYCLLKKGTTESFPFGETTLVFKVMEKLYALVSLDNDPLRVNLKCDPEYAIQLREENDAIIPGYHMNKKHWNSLMIDGRISDRLIKELIDHSYELVVKKLKKADRDFLAAL